MGSLWTLPAPWTRRRAHRALDRPQTACPQRPQALISSCYQPGGGGIFDDRMECAPVGGQRQATVLTGRGVC